MNTVNTVNIEDLTEPDDTPEVSASEQMADSFDAIRVRAAIAGLQVEDSVDFAGDPVLTIDMPNGREKRRVTIDVEDAKGLAATRFEDVRFLGRLQASYDVGTGQIEAGIISGSRNLLVSHQLRRIPNPARARSQHDGERDVDEEVQPSSRTIIHLVVGTEPGSSLEISLASDRAKALGIAGNYSLKIKHVPDSTHDAALQALESVAWPFFFDLDLRFPRCWHT